MGDQEGEKESTADAVDDLEINFATKKKKKKKKVCVNQLFVFEAYLNVSVHFSICVA